MDADRIVDHVRVTASHRHGDRHAPVAARREDHFITCGKAVEAQRQATQTVIAVGVGASQIDDEVRPRTREHLVECPGQLLQVDGIAGTVRSPTSRSLIALAKGKFFWAWIEKVKTEASSAQMLAVPLP